MDLKTLKSIIKFFYFAFAQEEEMMKFRKTTPNSQLRTPNSELVLKLSLHFRNQPQVFTEHEF